MFVAPVPRSYGECAGEAHGRGRRLMMVRDVQEILPEQESRTCRYAIAVFTFGPATKT